MDMKQIKLLMKEFDESTLSSMKINQEGFSIELEKATIASAVAAPILATPTAAPAETTPVVEEIAGEKILSPMVGTYYASPSPDSPVFVKEGDVIKKGQPLAILEAMKIMNEIEAEFDCKILKILVEDGKPVEYDMPLFAVEKI
ncbi:acetyl-CoA carboxylase biotin carboxyl carrier protein [Sulfurimonas sp. MAG313]|nr:acetyl-CoA carboxylase biotin carboxyl carrier protein [Sulfurimonas sp. MAG313]MDF1881196.1 acetyl-CoA carboxylase biotin carboxyl carrier protein [Sulfurimonas sp. MAG313]